MRLEQLQCVITVADLNSVRQAADQLYVTPQNVSKSIHQLEEELNILIFNRTKTGMYLTSEGQLVYDTAQDILQRVDYLSNVFLSTEYLPEHSKIEGTLKLLHGASLSPTIYRLQRILINRYPNVKIFISEQDAKYIDNEINSISKKEKEDFQYNMIFFTTFKAENIFPKKIYDLFDVYFLKNEKSGLLMRQDDSLARKSFISIKELCKIPIVSYSTSDETIMPAKELENYGIHITPIITTNSFTSWEQYIRDGVAYGLVGSDYMLTRSPEHGKIVFVPFSENMITSHFLLTKKKSMLEPKEKVFLEIIRDHYMNTIQLVNNY